ncbi:hypothetical protein [Geoalkalibacter halelectricus]|uniref:Outer membrane protein beta-barrel domain-containing protein n=1 Tax=Geoalkalibacter halelectricus TaxID=2847045 RepID=A0ABY5ZQM0_9BACT|nr:hypothetical protein [Geoalkalibacter halelectricus]MDO3378438.1 hypothetical protein [Geoalkalibacter halelectricus]UWZ80242.1 hypothetical protein L9S41_02305 [Geoalkalibacter halelectricus]
MKRAIFFLSFVFFCASSAFAFNLGPATPSADHGEVNLGIGYFYKQAEWDGNIDIEQNRVYLHIGYGMGIEDEPRWEAYLRLGAADFEANGFDSGLKPAFAAGVKGAFYEGRCFGWGMVAQGAYFSKWRDRGVGVEDAWEIELGFPFQAQLNPAIFYAGPVVYHTQAKASSGLGETSLNEKNNVGVFGGVRLDLGPIGLEVEAQYKSDVSAGALLSFQF